MKRFKKSKLAVMLTALLAFQIQLIPDQAHAQVWQEKKKIEFGDEAAVYLNGKKITIGDAIRLAIQSNYDLLSGAYELAMLDSNYKMYQKKYSTFLQAEAEGAYQEYPDSTAILTGTDNETWSGSVAIAKSYPTGTLLTAGLSHEYSNSTMSPIAFTLPGLGTISLPSFGDPEYHQPVAFISVKQELLQNGFGQNDRREQKQIANAAFMQKDTILYQLSLVVVKVVMDYWNVVLKESALSNAELQYEEVKSVRDITASNVRLGKTNQFELHYYNVLVASAKSMRLAALQDYKNAKRTFLRSINLNNDALLEGPAVLIDKLPELKATAALETAYAKRADYLGAKRMLDHARWELEIADNLAMPALTAEFTFNTMGQRLGSSDAYSDLAGFEKIGYSGGLSLVYPLGGDPVQEVKARNARYSKKQAEISIKKYERQIKDEIEQQIEQLNTVYTLYETAKEARKEAEAFYKLMLGQLRRGRLSASTVKNGVDALAQSRQQELAALIQFNMANLQFVVTKNELFEKYGINPDDYIPKQ